MHIAPDVHFHRVVASIPACSRESQSSGAATGLLSAPLPDAGEPIERLEDKVELTPEEAEQERVRQEFLRQLSGDSLFLDSTELAQRNGGGDGDGGSDIISIGGDNDDDSEDVGDLHARNIKRAQRRFNVNLKQTDSTATAEEIGMGAKNISLGPPGSVPLGQAMRAAAAARGEDAAAKQDVWAELGLMKPEQTAEEEEAEAAEAEDADPFAAFSELALPEAAAPAGGTDGGTAVADDVTSSRGDLVAKPTVGTQAPQEEVPISQASAGEAATAQAAPAPADALPGAPVNAGQAPGFLMGVNCMFRGQWPQALQNFAQAYQACSGMERVQVGQYIAVIGILEAYANVGDAETTRLSRFAAAMPLLLLDHASFLVNDAVMRNMRVGNSTWCAQRLEDFVTRCSASGNHHVAQGAAAKLQEVQSVGPGNSSVMKDEDTTLFVQRIDDAPGPQQIYGIVSSLRAGLL